MQRLIRFQVRPVDHDQRLGYPGEPLARQRRVDCASIPVHVAVAEQPIGALDLIAQARPASEAPADGGQCQPRATHRRRHRLQQGCQPPRVYASEQRAEAAV